MGDLIQQPQQLTLLIIYITNLYHKLYQRIFYSQVHRSIYKDSSCSRHKVKKQLKSLNHRSKSIFGKIFNVAEQKLCHLQTTKYHVS